jgi:hypothetical protein
MNKKDRKILEEELQNINEGFGYVVLAVIIALLAFAGFREYRDEKKARTLALKIAPMVAKKLESEIPKLVAPLMLLGKKIVSIASNKEKYIAINALRINENKDKLLNSETYRQAIKTYIFENIKSYIRYKRPVQKYTEGIFLTYGLETYVGMVTAGDDLSENLVEEMEKRDLQYNNEDNGEPSPLYMKYWRDCDEIIGEVESIDERSKKLLYSFTLKVIGFATTLVKKYKE